MSASVILGNTSGAPPGVLLVSSLFSVLLSTVGLAVLRFTRPSVLGRRRHYSDDIAGPDATAYRLLGIFGVLLLYIGLVLSSMPWILGETSGGEDKAATMLQCMQVLLCYVAERILSGSRTETHSLYTFACVVVWFGTTLVEWAGPRAHDSMMTGLAGQIAGCDGGYRSPFLIYAPLWLTSLTLGTVLLFCGYGDTEKTYSADEAFSVCSSDEEGCRPRPSPEQQRRQQSNTALRRLLLPVVHGFAVSMACFVFASGVERNVMGWVFFGAVLLVIAAICAWQWLWCLDMSLTLWGLLSQDTVCIAKLAQGHLVFRDFRWDPDSEIGILTVWKKPGVWLFLLGYFLVVSVLTVFLLLPQDEEDEDDPELSIAESLEEDDFDTSAQEDFDEERDGKHALADPAALKSSLNPSKKRQPARVALVPLSQWFLFILILWFGYYGMTEPLIATTYETPTAHWVQERTAPAKGRNTTHPPHYSSGQSYVDLIPSLYDRRLPCSAMVITFNTVIRAPMQVIAFLSVMLRPSFMPRGLLRNLQAAFIVNQAPGWFVGPMVLILLVTFVDLTGPGHSLFEANFASGFWHFLGFSFFSVVLAWSFEAFPETGVSGHGSHHRSRRKSPATSAVTSGYTSPVEDNDCLEEAFQHSRKAMDCTADHQARHFEIDFSRASTSASLQTTRDTLEIDNRILAKVQADEEYSNITPSEDGHAKVIQAGQERIESRFSSVDDMKPQSSKTVTWIQGFADCRLLGVAGAVGLLVVVMVSMYYGSTRSFLEFEYRVSDVIVKKAAPTLLDLWRALGKLDRSLQAFAIVTLVGTLAAWVFLVALELRQAVDVPGLGCLLSRERCRLLELLVRPWVMVDLWAVSVLLTYYIVTSRNKGSIEVCANIPENPWGILAICIMFLASKGLICAAKGVLQLEPDRRSHNQRPSGLPGGKTLWTVSGSVMFIFWLVLLFCNGPATIREISDLQDFNHALKVLLPLTNKKLHDKIPHSAGNCEALWQQRIKTGKELYAGADADFHRSCKGSSKPLAVYHKKGLGGEASWVTGLNSLEILDIEVPRPSRDHLQTEHWNLTLSGRFNDIHLWLKVNLGETELINDYMCCDKPYNFKIQIVANCTAGAGFSGIAVKVAELDRIEWVQHKTNIITADDFHSGASSLEVNYGSISAVQEALRNVLTMKTGQLVVENPDRSDYNPLKEAASVADEIMELNTGHRCGVARTPEGVPLSWR